MLQVVQSRLGTLAGKECTQGCGVVVENHEVSGSNPSRGESIRWFLHICHSAGWQCYLTLVDGGRWWYSMELVEGRTTWFRHHDYKKKKFSQRIRCIRTCSKEKSYWSFLKVVDFRDKEWNEKEDNSIFDLFLMKINYVLICGFSFIFALDLGFLPLYGHIIIMTYAI